MLFYLLIYLIFFVLFYCVNIELKEVLIIAGNFSLNGELTNLAQYDITTGM